MRELRRGSRAKRSFLQKMRTLLFLGAMPCLRKDRLAQRLFERLPLLRVRPQGKRRHRVLFHNRAGAERRRQKRPFFPAQKAFFSRRASREKPWRREPSRVDLRRHALRPARNRRRLDEMRLELKRDASHRVRAFLSARLEFYFAKNEKSARTFPRTLLQFEKPLDQNRDF